MHEAHAQLRSLHLNATEAAPFAAPREGSLSLGNLKMIQMHIIVLSQPEFVDRQVRTALSAERPSRGVRALFGWLRH